jgi:methyl-accepting chemotaxis protein
MRKKENNKEERKNKKTKSISRKISTVMIFITIFSIILVGGINYYNSYNLYKEKLIDSSEQTLEYIELSIDNYFTDIENQLQVLAKDDKVINFFNEEITEEDFMIKLKDFKDLDDNTLTVYFGTSDKRMVLYPKVPLTNYDPTIREWYTLAQANKDKVIWVNPYVDAGTGKIVITAAKAVLKDNSVVGVVGIDIDLAVLSDQLTNLVIGDSGNIIITDQNGVNLIAKDINTIGNSTITDLKLWEDMTSSEYGISEYEDASNNKYYGVFRTNERTGWKLAALLPETELTQKTSALLMNTIIIAIIAVVIAVIATLILSKDISKKVNKLQKSFEKASEGALNIDARIESKDEFGAISFNFNDMLIKIRNTLKKVSDSSGEVVEASDMILGMTKEANMALNEVSQTIYEIAKGTQEQAEDIEKNSQNIMEFSKVLDEVSDAIEKINELSKEADRYSNDGLLRVEELTDKAKKTEDATNFTNDVINEVKNNSNEINVITDTINQIAEQTNLLALNAAIEAARAGEAGRGFSVVAEEIRKLAEKSQHATKDIASLINSMNDRSDEAVLAMSKAKIMVNEQVDTVAKTKDAFIQILNSINALSDKVSSISELVQDLKSRKNEILENTQNISAVSEEISASTQEVSASTEEITATTASFVEYAEQLKNISDQLEKIISSFQI